MRRLYFVQKIPLFLCFYAFKLVVDIFSLNLLKSARYLLYGTSETLKWFSGVYPKVPNRRACKTLGFKDFGKGRINSLEYDSSDAATMDEISFVLGQCSDGARNFEYPGKTRSSNDYDLCSGSSKKCCGKENRRLILQGRLET